MPKAVLITSHFWNSKRKAGFHNIAESLLKKNYEVLFLTGSASYIHHLKGDYRAALINKSSLNALTTDSENFKQFIKFTALHPVNYRNFVLNKIFLSSVKKYSNTLSGYNELNEFIRSSDLFIFESFPGLLWFDHFKSLNEQAKYVYRVSDDMRQLNKHPYVIEHEMKLISLFDLISVPSEYFLQLFIKGNVKLHLHGISKDLFDKVSDNPYKNSDSFKFVFTGNAYLDNEFLKIALKASLNDEFHILGPFKKTKSNEKTFYYGEIDFHKTIPFIKFADAGLHTLEYSRGAESFSDSLKVIQYTYCRLPVIAPDFIKSSRNNFIFYKPGNNESIRKALGKAKEFDKSKIDVSGINSWDELTDKLIKE